MEIKLDIPNYNPSEGLTYKWTDNFNISVSQSNNTVIITENKEGLLSLANHLLNLAQDSVPQHCHLHLDEYNSLEDGSSELIIEKDNI